MSGRSRGLGADPRYRTALRVSRSLGPGSRGLPQPDRKSRRASRDPRAGSRGGRVLDPSAPVARRPGRPPRRRRGGRLSKSPISSQPTIPACASYAIAMQMLTSGLSTRPSLLSWSDLGRRSSPRWTAVTFRCSDRATGTRSTSCRRDQHVPRPDRRVARRPAKQGDVSAPRALRSPKGRRYRWERLIRPNNRDKVDPAWLIGRRTGRAGTPGRHRRKPVPARA